ncbi:MAG: hypothetical protein AABX37_00950 [Nanoarchaeota archaeon]
MNVEQHHSLQIWGKYLGFLISYGIFTTLLFFILTLTKKLPGTWDYSHIAVITVGITFLGLLLRRLLK